MDVLIRFLQYFQPALLPQSGVNILGGEWRAWQPQLGWGLGDWETTSLHKNVGQWDLWRQYLHWSPSFTLRSYLIPARPRSLSSESPMHFSTFQTLLWGREAQSSVQSKERIPNRNKNHPVKYRCLHFVSVGAMFPSVSDIPIICCCKQIDVSGYSNNSPGTHQGWRRGSYLLFISNSLYPPLYWLPWMAFKQILIEAQPTGHPPSRQNVGKCLNSIQKFKLMIGRTSKEPTNTVYCSYRV